MLHGLIGCYAFMYVDCKTNAILIIYLHMQNLNTEVCCTLKKSLYEVIYGQPPRTTPFTELPKGKEPYVMEEEVADLMYGKHNMY